MDDRQRAGLNMLIAIFGVIVLIVVPPASLPELLRWGLVAFFLMLAFDSIRRWVSD
jgi:hypothetical protein